jgi:hypothetical protein
VIDTHVTGMSHEKDPVEGRGRREDRADRGLLRALVDRLRRHDREWADRYVEMRFDAGR